MFYEFEIETKSQKEIVDITREVLSIVENSGIKEGIVHIFVPHATASLILNESADPNIKRDLLNVLEKIIPEGANYLHDRIDENASAHIRSAIIGCDITMPLHKGEVCLGTWQSIMFCEFDGPRKRRKIVVKIISG